MERDFSVSLTLSEGGVEVEVRSGWRRVRRWVAWWSFSERSGRGVYGFLGFFGGLSDFASNVYLCYILVVNVRIFFSKLLPSFVFSSPPWLILPVSTIKL